MAETVFAKIVAGEIPCEKIYEDEHTFAFLDANPVNPGHVLVIPKEPYENMFAMPRAAWLQVMQTVHFLAPAVMEATGAEGINIGMNNKEAAGQTVFHAHVHIMPRFTDDGHEHWRARPYGEGQMAACAQKIRTALAREPRRR